MLRVYLLALAAMILVATSVCCAQQPENLCPNPGAEEGDTAPAGWYNEGGLGTWGEDEVHSGARSFKLQQLDGEGTRSWTSPMIPVPAPGESQFMLSVWAKLDQVSGRNGAFIGFYHTDENGERIGQSGGVTIGGDGANVATFDWEEFIAMSALSPEVKGVRVNIRLYGATGTAWFDDLVVRAHSSAPSPHLPGSVAACGSTNPARAQSSPPTAPPPTNSCAGSMSA